MLREDELDAEFEHSFSELMESEETQAKLGKNIKKMAMPKATEHIVDEIEKLLK